MMKQKNIFTIIILLLPLLHFGQNKFTLSGYVKEQSTGEMLIGATIQVAEAKAATSANSYGFYSITLPEGSYTVTYSFIGYDNATRTVELKKNSSVNVELGENTKELQEVVVTSEHADKNVKSNEMSTVKLETKLLKQLPVAMGESDVIKIVQVMPGVQAPSEGSSGYTVRGGALDHNLILLDEATVYNASHIMGFVSVFNSDAVKDVKMYKGDIPAAYGGRLASVLDVKQKDGNKKRFGASGGIGLISSRLTIEGPIKKDKASFLLSGRRSYVDLFFPLIPDTNVQKSKLYFYDLNAKINYEISDNDKLFVSGYFGRDNMMFDKTMGFQWGNRTSSLRWNHLFGQKLFSNLTIIFSDYTYELMQETPTIDASWTSQMSDYGFKYDFSYYLNSHNTLRWGFQSTYHSYYPGKFNIDFTDTKTKKVTNQKMTMPESHALEHGVFLSNEQEITDRLSCEYGIRGSAFQSMGTSTWYETNEKHAVVDTHKYKKNDIYNTYGGIEPRLRARYKTGQNSSVKASYNHTMQYVQIASNTIGGSPLDVWFPASPLVKPQVSDLFVLGYFKNLRENMFELSIEAYYKMLSNQVDFRDNANLLANPLIESELRFGKGEAYGIETQVNKRTGKVTGWVSYTWSRSWRTFEELNDGKRFHASNDRPHNISIVANYDVNKRLTLSAMFVFMSGSPATLPTGRYKFQNQLIPVYSSKNAARLPDYHRADLGLTWKCKEMEGRKYFWDLNFSVYNVYNRKNAYALFFENDPDDPNKMKTFQMSIFPIIPSVTYNFKF